MHFPSALRTGHHVNPLFKERDSIKVSLRERPGDAAQHQLYRALAEFAELQRRKARLSRMQGDSRISARHLCDDRREQSCGHAFGAAKTKLPCHRVREEAEFIRNLPQLVEYCDGALQEGLSIFGWDKPFRSAVEKTHAKRLLGLGNGFRHGRL